MPFDVAGDRATRDAFRIARSEMGESTCDWQKAHCPPPISKAEAEKREQEERKERDKAEAARRADEMQRLDQSRQERVTSVKVASTVLTSQEMTAEDRREVEGRGFTPEQRMKLERERRARAAEQRLKRIAS